MTVPNDDTWGPATSVGTTATMAAAARAIATRDGVINDPFAEPLVRAVGVNFLTRWAIGELVASDVDVEGSPWGLAQMPAAIAARTRYFDEFYADAAAAGIRQAVILASGLDTRAYRLDWPAGMTVFEIDQPAVVEFKTTALARLAAEPKADLRTVAVDLRDDWSTALATAGLDSSKPTAWIAEGLFGYLAPEAQDRLLDAVTALSTPGSRLGSEAVPDTADMDPHAARQRMRAATAKWRDHGFELDVDVISFAGERHDVGAYLQALGWTTVATPMAELLADQGLPAIARADDDRQTMNGVTYYTSTLGTGRQR
ncbi:SAM-dependent methyltransferase [Mycobacterium avium subsp. hominissuis 101]|uniref:Putative S-adenosyl-L-methionine-dependent methyltransferase MAV_4573 n=6 Tax=Mycobacterium avium TaxID=1764 RepID=Y4573_MYCA1|nr:SAM-dependent methyltransferase [Mycobacterium avium]A0QLB4.1 RecName: Full=Putative S-adenosyl-L-methionine-dependent methyltransferase MAV_4573 [Mycobacterium avium 104]EUA37334.1 methyltransferase, TIGR00027 family protein [Mycobacterium avium subsp. avium 2285 (R)]KDP02183.1 SAM-dependent methyltransferase [Mycobacterium avium subsp. hominissuis 101]TXA39361.1 SAM-dependent methyltransferase [Mycobacterium tuberculosis variant bovis]ABK68210.1 putative methyltransferase [Mycobacterium a